MMIMEETLLEANESDANLETQNQSPPATSPAKVTAPSTADAQDPKNNEEENQQEEETLNIEIN